MRYKDLQRMPPNVRDVSYEHLEGICLVAYIPYSDGEYAVSFRTHGSIEIVFLSIEAGEEFFNTIIRSNEVERADLYVKDLAYPLGRRMISSWVNS